jgi:exonuclease SbcC
VESIPESTRPEELAVARSELDAAESNVAMRQEVAQKARTALAEFEAKQAVLRSRREDLATRVGHGPDREELTRLEALAEDIKGRLVEARALVVEAETRVRETATVLEDLAGRENAIGRLLQTALMTVAAVGLDPPVSASDDAVVQWKDLLEWRESARSQVHADLAAAGEAATRARSVFEDAKERLVEEMASVGLAGVEPYSAILAAETEKARQLLGQHEKAVADGVALREQIDIESSAAAVAGALATHLRADGFERWMMAGALHTLVVGANDLLSQLSDGGYSLHSEEGTFAVIDHRNADERRSVSTLSGGETFLVSLALALSLAETLAGSGGAKLDAIILDEGFGTLDDESLDIVASVLEELAGQGLMVGVITHVKELAARATVRFEVTRGARGSAVREVA